MGGHTIHRMYIDGGSSMEILYEHCFNRLQPEIKNQMVPATASLKGFSGETTWPLGQLKLLVTIGDITHSTKAWMNFMIVKSLSPYNGIIGRPGLKAIQAVPSTVHGMLKFPTEKGIVTIRSSLLVPAECTSIDTSSPIPREKTHPTNLTVPLHPNFPDQEVVPSDMTGVPRSIAEHKLNIREGCPPVRQKKRGQAPERTKAIQAEVQKLIEVRIMREVYYHDWLSNPVMVKKYDGSWRMCVDFTDLNKACPQDCYPLSGIDWKVESLCGYPFKCFLDAYKGYHQIQLAAADEEKTAFHTGQGVYCYTKMPFGLKNAGATYQRLMDKAFKSQMGQNIKVYVDDLVVKSYTKAEMRGPADRTRDGPDASLIYKPCTTGSGTKLLTDVKTGCITGLCGKKTSNIFLGTSYHDFLNEMPSNASQGVSVAETQEEPWTLFTDGSSCVDGSDAGLILTTPDGVEFTYALSQVPRSRNKKADALSKIASTSFAHLSKQVLVEVLETKSITGKEVTAVIEEEGPTWMTKLVNYLKEGILPGDEKEARKLRLKARQYELSFTNNHSLHRGPQSVVAKAIRLGYFWPTMHKDAQDMIRKCSDCQIHRPFPEGPGKVKFLIVAMDYFTKWIEAKPVATITGGQVKKFVWGNIVCLFGIPGEIISDNGKQFADNPFKDWCDKLNITQRFASVKHPQSNGLVERANRSLGEGIKARLGEGNKNWVEELPHVLWAHRTIIKSSHGDTPFSLTYRTEAVIPAEIGMPTYHTTAVDVVDNDEELHLNLDLLEERPELAAMSEARSKSKMMKYYNSRVRGVAFKPGDFVYRSNNTSHAVAGGKLGPKWEGPYEVTDALGNGAYKLRSTDGTMLPRM
uniref:Reverse transcriptase domain-containing protein n=1 Tax=Tanacetum cinerariifolium TaxID=118510 RepID=A0A699GS86_TANCI|nr:reverse transcriptase domain-containing protein [Tanacetum cinerariifolium]